jgi:DNA (cytosine-5)-methyltransferase 1
MRTLPTMDDVRAVPWNGLRAASLFAGAGGSSIGYRLAGWRVVYADEMNDHARETYKRNSDPLTTVSDRDIRTVRGSQVLEAVRADGSDQLDLLDGSPPCQDFSLAGRRDMAGENALLYYEAIRLVGEVRPRVFAFENVKGLGQGRARGHMIRIVDQLKAHGYRVRRGVLDFSRLGVPQSRERLMIIGFREDLGVDPRLAFPSLQHPRATVNEYLPHVGHFGPAPTITRGGGDEILSWAVEGGERRGLTLDEIRILSTFPDGFEIGGTTTQKLACLGNAVPPLAARAWGAQIAEALGHSRLRAQVGT